MAAAKTYRPYDRRGRNIENRQESLGECRKLILINRITFTKLCQRDTQLIKFGLLSRQSVVKISLF
jgi:hypothetical protein